MRLQKDFKHKILLIFAIRNAVSFLLVANYILKKESVSTQSESKFKLSIKLNLNSNKAVRVH